MAFTPPPPSHRISTICLEIEWFPGFQMFDFQIPTVVRYVYATVRTKQQVCAKLALENFTNVRSDLHDLDEDLCEFHLTKKNCGWKICTKKPFFTKLSAIVRILI
jgi:hypothetical protein